MLNFRIRNICNLPFRVFLWSCVRLSGSRLWLAISSDRRFRGLWEGPRLEGELKDEKPQLYDSKLGFAAVVNI
jgi:hypothetical protein